MSDFRARSSSTSGSEERFLIHLLEARRLSGVATTLASLACVVAVLTLPARVLPIPQPTMLQPGSFSMVGRQVATAERDADNDHPGHPGSLGILLGSSSLEAGIDLRALGPGPAGASRWISLFGYDQSITTLEAIARIPLSSRLHPLAIGLAINKGMLAHSVVDRGDYQPWAADGSWVGRRAYSLLFPGRDRMRLHAQRFVAETRIRMLHPLGVAMAELFEPEPGHGLGDDPGVVPPSLLAWQRNEFERRGWFSASSYSADNPEAQALRRLIRSIRARGSTAFIIVLPDPSALRRSLPAEARTCLVAVLREAFPSDPPLVVDFHDAMADADFYDLGHLRPVGARELARKLQEHFAAMESAALAR